ncbi:MAG: uroporphyrinogen-III synthase [Flavobacteriales bacterium]
MSQTVFISRELPADNHLLTTLAAEGFELIAQPMITTRSVACEMPTIRSGWIFFSSKQGVEHFFAHTPSVGSAQLAAIGEGTARLLRKYGEVEFTGRHSDTDEVAREFKKTAGRKKVYFPISEQSVRTVQQALPASQVVDIVCYRTEENPVPVGHPDILIFSSPSNVQAFLKANTIMPFQKVIAFGKTTAAALEEAGVKSVVSKGTSDSALLEAIKRASASSVRP